MDIEWKSGHYYKTRNGEIVRVNFIHPDDGKIQFIIFGSWNNLNFKWRKDGHWIGDDEHPFDIIGISEKNEIPLD